MPREGLPVSVAPHTQQLRQSLQKQTLYPGGHGVVGSRRAMVDIDHKNCDYDRKGDKDHDEEEVLSNKWDHLLKDKTEILIQTLLTLKLMCDANGRVSY